MHPCTHCQGFGYVQVYWTVVFRVYCDCEAGSKRIQDVRGALEEVGIDPDSPEFRWIRKADVPNPYQRDAAKSQEPSCADAVSDDEET
jgi:hypothetical protein